MTEVVRRNNEDDNLNLMLFRNTIRILLAAVRAKGGQWHL